MNKVLSVVAMCALFCPIVLTHADDKAKAPAGKTGDMPAMPAMSEADQKAMKEKYAQAGKPGPMHEWMRQCEGTWTTTTREMGMDGKWTESKGECVNTMIHGGRFMEINFKGESHSQPYLGRGVMGYNNVDKRFESVWYDSMSSSIMVLNGEADKDGKVLTLKGKFTDPADGQIKDFREVMTIESKDRHHSDFYMSMPGPDGKPMEMKIMEITYTKGKAADAKSEKAIEKIEKKKN